MIGARGFSDLLRATEGRAGVYFGERKIAPGELGIAGDHSPHGLDGRQSILANESPRVEVDVAQVVRMVLREVVVLAAVGLAIGAPTALGASKFVESFLFGMRPNDPRALALAVAILLSAALLAGYFPARKASRIDPMIALRHE